MKSLLLLLLGALCGAVATVVLFTVDPSFDGTEADGAGGGNVTLVLSDITTACIADLDLDNDVDSSDLNVMLSDFGCTGAGCPGDINLDGHTDSTDLNILLSVFGAVCP